MFLSYVHPSSCFIDNTSLVATATRNNLFTPASLHAVAPHCAVPNPALCWSCWWRSNFWFPAQLITQFLLQGLLSGCTLYCSQSLVLFVMLTGHPVCSAHKMICNYGKFRISDNSIPTKKTHHVTGHSHSMIIPHQTVGMIYCCIECTEKAPPYNINWVTVIMDSKHLSTISSFNKE